MKREVLSILILFSAYGIGWSQAPGAPTELQASYNANSKTIELVWSPAPSKVAGYNLFVKQGEAKNFILWGKAGLIPSESYDFEVKSRIGEFYEFKVCAVQNFPDVIRSDNSNAVVVEIPSSFLPMVKLNEPKVRKKSAEIIWGYNVKASDLAGFIIYLNKEELKVMANNRSYLFNDLKPGKYSVYIIAVTKTGLKSAPSSKKFIVIK